MNDAWDSGDAWSKVRENRVRRSAERQGYSLHRTRRRDTRALDFGRYSLASSHAATASTASPQGATLSEVEAFLNGEDNDKSKRR